MSRIKPLADGIRLNCTIVSDTHIDIKHPRPWLPQWRLKTVLKDAKKSRAPIDVLMTVGDTTSRSSDINWEMTKDCFDAVKDPAGKIILPIGNHDGWHDNGFEAAKQNYLRYSNLICGDDHADTYFSYLIKGYPFICLGTDSDAGCEAQISDRQIAWFEEEMKKAGETGKPIFVFCHQCLNKTHGLPRTNDIDETYESEWEGGIGEKSDKIEAVMKQYKNVFYFSGHLHMGISGEQTRAKEGYSTVEEKDGMTLINMPSLACGNHHGETRAFCTGFQMEVYDDRVVLRPRSYKLKKWLSVPMKDGENYYEKKL